MSVYALIKDKEVINTILWEGPEITPMDFGEGVTFSEIPDAKGTTPSIGWKFDKGLFIAPPPTVEDENEKKQTILKSNMSTKQLLIQQLSQTISILQDAVDLDMATDEEARLLPLWKKYRVLVNRIDANTTEQIKWPEEPK